MKIAINGSLGSGKSTVAKALAKELGYEYISTGSWFRELAKESGMSVVDFSAKAERDSSIDEEIDGRLKQLNNDERDLVIDSRMAPFFITTAFKIRLIVSDEEGARRIYQDELRGEVESFQSMEDAMLGYRIRSESERVRYLQKYHVNIEDISTYDLIIDTSLEPAEQIVQRILKALPND